MSWVANLYYERQDGSIGCVILGEVLQERLLDALRQHAKYYREELGYKIVPNTKVHEVCPTCEGSGITLHCRKTRKHSISHAHSCYRTCVKCTGNGTLTTLFYNF